MHIYHKDIKPPTSQHCIWQSVENKYYLLYCWFYSTVFKNPFAFDDFNFLYRRKIRNPLLLVRIFLSPEQAFLMWVFLNKVFLHGVFVSSSPNPQERGPNLVVCPRLLIQFNRIYPPYWKPFLYLQPEYATCLGDRDPLEGTTPTLWFIVLLLEKLPLDASFYCNPTRCTVFSAYIQRYEEMKD